jgi:NADPH:quinone reductase-like Zn-dependent oxidoreductase
MPSEKNEYSLFSVQHEFVVLEASYRPALLTSIHSVYPLIDPATSWKEKSFSGKVVLITGASRGIGLTTAIFYARAGARLALVSRKQQALEESKATILKEQPDAEVLTFSADVVDAKIAESVVRKTVEVFGQLDILLANAGLTTPMDQRMRFNILNSG